MKKFFRSLLLGIALVVGVAHVPQLFAATEAVSPTPKLRFEDSNGNALIGGKLFTYASGTTNKQTTYTDSTGGTPNANPVILDSRGEANVWLDPTLSYKFTLSPSTDTDPPTNPIWTVDSFGGSLNISTLSGTGAGQGSALVGHKTTNMAATTVFQQLIAIQSAWTTTGTPPNYAITPNPAITGYTAGMVFDVTFAAASAGMDTLSINGIATPPNLVKENIDGSYSNIAANDIPANHTSQVRLISSTQALVRSIPTTPLLKHGSVRFVNVSPFATNVNLAPFNGNGLLVKNSTGWEMVALSSAGLTANITGCNLNGVGSQTLSNGTLYYAYVAFIGGVPQLDFSTTGHATDATTGVEIKSGDATRTLVGMLYVGTGSNGMTAGSIAGTASNQLVSGWFNRIASDEYITISGGNSSATYAELVNTNRINFVMWSDDDPYSVATAVVSNAGAGNITYIGIGVDSATVPSGTQGANQAAANSYQASVMAIPITGGMSEAFHYLTSQMKTSAGAGTVVMGQIHLYLRS